MNAPLAAAGKEVDVLLALVGEEWAEIHHLEGQRATLANILLAFESAAVALIVQAGYSAPTLSLCILLVVFAVVGILATWKYRERFLFAQARLTGLYREIDVLCPGARVIDLHRAANSKHEKNGQAMIMRRYHLQRLSLYRIWAWLHGVFAATGLVLCAVVLGRAFG